jgi:hypothetical protein
MIERSLSLKDIIDLSEKDIDTSGPQGDNDPRGTP